MTTRYEVILETPAGRETLGFSARKTKGALLAYAREAREQILAHLGDADPEPSFDPAWGWTFGPCRVRFSGETEKTVKG